MSDKVQQEVIKWTGIVAFLTAFSKVLGFLRETSIAFVFGTTIGADAYFMALLVPSILFNAFYNAIARAFIPVYGNLRHRREGQSFANTFLLLVLPATAAIVLLIELFTPQVVRALAPGFSGEVFTLTVTLVRVVSLSLIMMGLSGAATGYLQAHHSFLAPALIGFPMNLIVIAGALFFGTRYGVMGLAIATVVGYGSQFLIQVPWMIKQGFSLRAGLDFRHPGFREVKKILPPILVAGAAAELKALVDRMFASLLPAGAVSSLNYAARVRGLPVALFIIPLVTVVYPNLVDLAGAGNMERFKRTLARSLGVIIFLMLPISAGMIALSSPLTRLIFQRGAFDAAATATTSIALLFYALGMVGEGMNHLLSCSFFALKDSRTPMYLTFFTTALNAVLNAVLISPLKHGGIALATSVCFLAGEAAALYLIWRKIGSFGGRLLLRGAGVSLLLSAIMGGALFLAADAWQKIWQPLSFMGQALQVGCLIAAGAGLYFLLAWLFKLPEMQEALDLAVNICQKLRARTSTP